MINSLNGKVFSVEKISEKFLKENHKKIETLMFCDGVQGESKDFVIKNSEEKDFVVYVTNVEILKTVYEIARHKINVHLWVTDNVVVRLSVADKDKQTLINCVNEAVEVRSSYLVSLEKRSSITHLPWIITIQISNELAALGIKHAICYSINGGCNLIIAKEGYQRPEFKHYEEQESYLCD